MAQQLESRQIPGQEQHDQSTAEREKHQQIDVERDMHGRALPEKWNQ